MRVPHIEGFWMAPEAKGNAGITRALWKAATAQASDWSRVWYYANAADQATRDTLLRLGGRWMPMETFMFLSQEATNAALERAVHAVYAEGGTDALG